MAGDYSRLSGTIVERERLAGLRMAMAGAGALGSEVVRLLGMCGVGDLLLVDSDAVEASNLTRAALCTPEDIGRNKAEALAARAAARFPDSRFEALACEIADVGWGRLAECRLILGCVDRDSARLEIARIATRLGIPVCDGGLGGASATTGRASWFPGGNGACFGCRLPAARRRELLSGWYSRPHPCAPAEGRAAHASTPLIASIAAGLLIDIAMRALGEMSAEGHTVEIRLAPDLCLERFTVPRAAGCPFHEPLPALRMARGTFADLLEGRGAAGWEWPMCTSARCSGCGRTSSPRVRASRLRALACAECGSRLLPVECVRHVNRESPWAACAPGELGLPDRHLYRTWEEAGR